MGWSLRLGQRSVQRLENLRGEVGLTRMAAEGSGPVAAGHIRTLWITPIPYSTHFAVTAEKPHPTTPSEAGKTDLNSLREAAALGGHKGPGFHCGIYPRACEIVIFVSKG